MVLVYRWVEGHSRQWEFEDHFCFEESLECWWERIHGIVGFEFDEAEDVCPVFAWNLIHTLSYKWGVYSIEEKDDMYCTCYFLLNVAASVWCAARSTIACCGLAIFF